MIDLDILDSPRALEILDESKSNLASALEHLASYNFEKFIFLLYRMDIDETKVKSVIAEQTNTYEQIADLIFTKLHERQNNRTLFTYPEIDDD